VALGQEILEIPAVDQATKNEVKQSKIDQFFCAEEGQEWTVSTTTATVQYIMTKILQDYSNFSFYNAVYSAHNENKTQYPDVDVYWWTPSVNETLFLLQNVLIG